jgi:hypothetical protein
MFTANQIVRAKRNHMLAKVKYVDSKKDMIQVEYLNPPSRNYYGLFTYPMRDFNQNWELVDNPDNKIISLITPQKQTQSSHCAHQWIKYHGFIHAYEYCSKCDKKR